MDGLVAEPIYPDGGVVAGCFSATYCLAAYLIEDLRQQQLEHVGVVLAMHVDDISQEVVGDSIQEVVTTLVDGARDLKAALEGDLDMTLAAAKGTLLGSSDEVTSAAQLALQSLGLPEAARPSARRRLRSAVNASVRHLGVDFRAGRRRRGPLGRPGVAHLAGPVRQRRVEAGRGRLRKALRAIKQVAGCKRIWHSAIVPAAELGDLRARAKALAGHPFIASDILEAALPGWSPLGRATVLTVERYAEEWWRASDVRQRNGRVLSLPELRGAYEAAAASFDGKLGEAGPVGAMLRSLHWAGWTSPSATSFRSPSAGVISVLETSPRQLGRIFKLDVLAQIELRADEAIRHRFNLGADFDGIWWEGVQAALKGSYCSALERHVIVSLLGGTYLTGERARDLGYLVDGMCATCGVPDTVAHRVGCCPRFAAGRAAETGWHGDLEAGRSLCDTVLLDLCLPSPPPRLPEPPRGEMRAFIGEREVPVKVFVFVPGEKIAGDGSCSTSPLTSLVRAGWDVVQWDAVQGVLHMIIGSIPSR
ncbi:unnamed protein product, partial [Prorocentrum cordatum]